MHDNQRAISTRKILRLESHIVDDVFRAINALSVNTVFVDFDFIKTYEDKFLENLKKSSVKRIVYVHKYASKAESIIKNFADKVEDVDLVLALYSPKLLANKSSNFYTQACNDFKGILEGNIFKIDKIKKFEVILDLYNPKTAHEAVEHSLSNSNKIFKIIINLNNIQANSNNFGDKHCSLLPFEKSKVRNFRFFHTKDNEVFNIKCIPLKDKVDKLLKSILSSNAESFYAPYILRDPEVTQFLINELPKTQIISPINLSSRIDRKITAVLSANYLKSQIFLMKIGISFARNKHNSLPFNVCQNILLFMFGLDYIQQHSTDEFHETPMLSMIESSYKLYRKKNV